MKIYLLLLTFCSIVFAEIPKKNIHVVILAGGVGSRLWPLSRKEKPKQFLPFIDDKSLLDLTIERVEGYVSQENITIVSVDEQTHLFESSKKAKDVEIIKEPDSRNTGPAILYTCLTIAKKDPDAIIVFLPADHFIPETELFLHYLTKGIENSYFKNQITLFGIKPRWAATGYGYIEYETEKMQDVFRVKRFHEKPNFEQAQNYIKNENMLWNSGIFCGKATGFIKNFKEYAHTLYSIMLAYFDKKASYSDLENISIDHAVLEKADNISVLPVDFSWSDVGNLDTFLSLKEDSNKKNKNVFLVDSKNNLISSKKLISLIGIQNLCIVETDDILFLAKREEVEKVKTIIELLKAKKKHNYL